MQNIWIYWKKLTKTRQIPIIFIPTLLKNTLLPLQIEKFFNKRGAQPLKTIMVIYCSYLIKMIKHIEKNKNQRKNHNITINKRKTMIILCNLLKVN